MGRWRHLLLSLLLWLPLALAAESAATDPAYSLDTFRARVGQTFLIYGAEGLQGARWTERVELMAVTDEGSNQQLEQFVVRLRAQRESALHKTIYTLEHEDGSRWRLFLEPDGEDSKGRYFVARFSLLKGFDPALAPHR